VSRPEIQARAAALRGDRVPFVHARVVVAERPTSAKPGDEAVVFADGTMEGFVGGTCAESTVRAQGIALLDTGEPLLLRITPSPEPGRTDPDGTLSVHNPCLSGGTLEIFLEPVVPSPLVLVLGDSPIAAALVRLGTGLGYDVRAADGDATVAGAAAFVVASHGRDEEDRLTAALAADVPYVGLVASRKRGEAVLASLDVDEEARGRVRTPAGLDIGARTPEEVALSILAEIVSHRRRVSGRPVGGDEVAHGNADLASDDATLAVPAQPVTAVDPVCGMSVAAVDASLHLDHDGVRYFFCGSGCLRAFAADPDSYLSSE
jgi:xanthine dehydrogenase accessory factor